MDVATTATTLGMTAVAVRVARAPGERCGERERETDI